MDGNNKKIEAFAANIRKWNRKYNRVTVGSIFAYLLLLTLYHVFMNEKEILGTQTGFFILEIVTLTGISAMYVLWHVAGYLFVNGKDGKVSQDVLNCLRYMPFSVESYFDFIYRRVKRGICGIGMASFIIIFAGCFCYAQNDPAGESVVMRVVEVQGVSQIWHYLLFAACETAFFMGIMHLCFHMARHLFCRVLQEENDDIKRKKNSRFREQIGMKTRKLTRTIRILVMAIVGLAVVIGIMMLTDRCYQTYYGWDSIYLITGNLSVVTTGILMFIMDAFVEFGSGFDRDMEVYIQNAEEKDNTSLGNKITTPMIVGGVVLLVVIGLVVTSFVYDRFTLEGIEEHRLVSVKTYSWDDVKSCTLKSGWGGNRILQFEMEDGSKVSYKESEWAMEYESQVFGDTFASEQYSSVELYIVWIAEEMTKQGVPFEADWEKLEEKLTGANVGWLKELREIVETDGCCQ